MKPYLIATIIGAFLQDIAINNATKVRGHIAFGGEYLILPLCILVVVIARDINRVIKAKEETEDVQK